MKGYLYTDGGSRGNPGQGASGAILFDGQGKLLDFDAAYLGVLTNNQAEYKALISGLELALTNDVDELEVAMDSELIVRQINGEYKVKNPDMKELKHEVDQLLVKFSKYSFVHVNRDRNKHADKLVNLILDARQ